MKKWVAVFACVLIDAVSVGRMVAQQPAPRALRAVTIRSGGYLGIGVEDIDEDRAKALKLPEVRGVEIKGVEDDSPASKAGLAKGDVVLEFNSQRVEGTDQFIRMVRETPAGHKIALQIIRNGATQTVSVVVAGRSTNQAWAAPMEGNGWSIGPDVPMPRMPAMPAMPAMPVAPRAARGLPLLMWQNGSVGIETESLTGQLAEYFGVKEGVLIRSVARNSPAEKGGLKAGDVVVKVNGETVATAGEVSSQVHSNGKHTIPFVVVRNHHDVTVTVTLADGWQNSESGEDL